MRNILTRVSTAGALLCAVACGSQKTTSPGPTLDGKATLSAPKVNALVAGDLMGSPVCADFTIIPYQLSAASTPPWAEEQTGQHIDFTTSGNPIAITVHNLSPDGNSAGDAVVSQEIIGCASGTLDTSGHNWGYWVTASNFKLCTPDSGGTALDTALAAIQPVIVDQPIDCEVSDDANFAISIPIDIPTTVQSGYVDVSASIDVTGVAVGCKIADFGSDNQLHWGQTYSPDSSADTGGATALTSLLEIGNTIVSQYSGGVQDESTSSNDYYATGEGSLYTELVYQMFYNPIELGAPVNGNSCGAVNSAYLYAGTKQAQCLTDNTGYVAPPATAPAPVTTADLADAVVMENNPGTIQGWATATVRVNTDSSSSNFGKQYIDILSSSGFEAFPELAASFTPGAYTGSPVNGHVDEGLSEHKIYLNEPFPIQGVYPNQTGWVYSTSANAGAGGWIQKLSFFVLVTTPSGGTTLFNVVDQDGYTAEWDNPYLAASTSACLGLFYQGETCVAPAAVPTGTTGPCGLPQAQFTVP